MGDIFKPRKIPRHLVIDDAYPRRSKSGFSLKKLVLILVVLGALAYAVLQMPI